MHFLPRPVCKQLVFKRFKNSMLHYIREPTYKGNSMLSSVSGGPENPLIGVELLNCNIPSRPSRNIRTQFHSSKITFSSELKQQNHN